MMDPGRPAPCQICERAGRPRQVYRLHDYSIVRCARCGLVYLDGSREVGMFGPVDAFGEHGYMPHLDIERIATEQVESVHAILRDAGAPLVSQGADLAVLDVGCARGYFLDRFRTATGRRALTGIDLSNEMTDWGRTAFGLDLRAGHIERSDLPRGHFGLVTMWDVLEHLPFPRRSVEQLFGLLAPGGWLVIEVPSETTTFRRLAALGYTLSAGRLAGPLRTLYHPAHLSYFTARSLRTLAAAVGARGVAMRTKEAHVTRFGLGRYPAPARLAIRALALADRMLGIEAKLLCAMQR